MKMLVDHAVLALPALNLVCWVLLCLAMPRKVDASHRIMEWMWKLPPVWVVAVIALTMIFGSVLGQIGGSVAGAMLHSDTVETCVSVVIHTLVCAIILRYFQNALKPRLNCMGGGQSFLHGLTLCGMALLPVAVNLVGTWMIVRTGEVLLTPWSVLVSAVAAFEPGFCEEITMRALILPCILYALRDRRGSETAAAVLSALVFGLVHLVNLAQAGTIETLLQVLYATGIGIAFAAVYLRTRNLWSVVIVHWLVDFTSFLVPTGAVADTDIGMMNYLFAVLIFVSSTVAGLYLLRPSKCFEVKKLWGLDTTGTSKIYTRG